MLKKSDVGFSLVELLITLAILGLIATFTLPSVFQVSGNRADTKYSQMAKNAALMVVSAYERYKIANPVVNANMQFYSLAPYMNYLKVDLSNSSHVNGPPAGTWYTGSETCGTQGVGNHYCYPLHNGGVIWFNDAFSFGGTNSTNALWFNFDPDGSGPAQALQIWLTYNGRIYTVKNLPTTMTTGYIFSTTTQAPTTQDAAWFTGF